MCCSAFVREFASQFQCVLCCVVCVYSVYAYDGRYTQSVERRKSVSLWVVHCILGGLYYSSSIFTMQNERGTALRMCARICYQQSRVHANASECVRANLCANVFDRLARLRIEFRCSSVFVRDFVIANRKLMYDDEWQRSAAPSMCPQLAATRLSSRSFNGSASTPSQKSYSTPRRRALGIIIDETTTARRAASTRSAHEMKTANQQLCEHARRHTASLPTYSAEVS